MGIIMTCPECDKKEKRIKELELMVERMSVSYDSLRPAEKNAEQVDFVKEGLEVITS